MSGNSDVLPCAWCKAEGMLMGFKTVAGRPSVTVSVCPQCKGAGCLPCIPAGPPAYYPERPGAWCFLCARLASSCVCETVPHEDAS